MCKICEKKTTVRGAQYRITTLAQQAEISRRIELPRQIGDSDSPPTNAAPPSGLAVASAPRIAAKTYVF